MIPDDWEWSEMKSSIALYEPKSGVGALNVSFIIAPAGEVIDLEGVIREAVPRSQKHAIIVARVQDMMNGYPTCRTEYSLGDKHWRVWAAVKERKVVVITYNCKKQVAGTEDDAVDQIISSLDFVGVGPEKSIP